MALQAELLPAPPENGPAQTRYFMMRRRYMQAETTSGKPTHSGYLVAIMLASYAMIVIDNSIVITGLPSIREGLGFSVGGLSWVQNAYALAFGGFMLLGARAGDLLGRRRLFIVGLGIFSMASFSIGLAGSPAWLVGARALQGIGAAILAPATLALLSTNFAEGPERNRVLGWYGAVGGITASVGLVAGGIVADLLSWRAGFFINVPIGALLIWGARRYITETPRQTGRFDIAGALLSTLGVVTLVYGLVHAAEESWYHPGTAIPLLAGILLLALFLPVERHASQPILPLRLFANSERSGATRLVRWCGNGVFLLHDTRPSGGTRHAPDAGWHRLLSLHAGQLPRRTGHPQAGEALQS
jgi:MFS family permease